MRRWFALCGLLAAHSTMAATPFDWGYLPKPIIPSANPISAAKVALGERLFVEPRLSANGSYSCASCHQPERHFTDARARAIGATGEQLPHNTPSLYNAAFNASYGWQDNGHDLLEAQHLTPLLNRAPLEMGFDQSSLHALKADPTYVNLFAAAFVDGVINTDNVVKALASYVRTLTPPVRPFDEYLFNDRTDAISKQAKLGMSLFFSPRLGCSECHASLNFSGPIKHQRRPQVAPVFHVTGVAGSTAGFRAPSLRMVRFTAPYMHDGSLDDLQAVIAHYTNNKIENVPRFTLTAAERDALIAFLQTL